jgi:cob(I)alamin adenosyltransferase
MRDFPQSKYRFMASKIYTRTGDKGATALIGGTKVPKSHLRIESYGTVDELNSFIGLLNDHLSVLAEGQPITAPRPPAAPGQAPVPSGHLSIAGAGQLIAASGQLKEIQDRLFTIGSSLACDPDKEPRLKIPDLKKEDVDWLEKEMDRMNEILPPMKSFVLPGGHPAVSTAHIARCVCRRAERICVHMQETQLYIEPIVIQYLNRLSDYLFVLARYTGHILQVPELPWKPRV